MEDIVQSKWIKEENYNQGGEFEGGLFDGVQLNWSIKIGAKGLLI